MIRLLVTHSWRDTATSDRLASDLENIAQIRLDVRGAHSDRPIDEQITEALADIDGLVLVWTTSAASSPGVAMEIAAADRLEIPIFACVFDGDMPESATVPNSLDSESSIDFSNETVGFGRLCAALLARLDDSVADLPPSILQADDLETVIEFFDGHNGSGPDSMVGRTVSALVGVKQRSARVAEQLSDGVALADRAKAAVERQPHDRHELEALLVAAATQETEYPGLMRHIRQMVEAALAELPEPNLADVEIPTLTTEPRTDEQLRRELVLMVGAEGVDETVDRVATYLRSAPDTLRTLHRVAGARGSPRIAGVVDGAIAYFRETDDLLPDHYGVLGRLDDSWLVHNLAYRMVESGLTSTAELGDEWRAALREDALVRGLLSGEVLHGLEALLLQWMDELAGEVAGYRPELAAQTDGHREPVITAPEPTRHVVTPAQSPPPTDVEPEQGRQWDTPEVSMFLGMFGLAVSIYYGLPGSPLPVRLLVAGLVLVLSIPIIALGARGVIGMVRVLSDPKKAADRLPEVWRRERRSHEVRWTSAVPWLVAIFVGIGFFIFWIGPEQQLEQDREELRADVATSEELANEANRMTLDRIDEGLLFALEAYRVAPTAAAMDALLTGLERSAHFVTQLAPPTAGTEVLATSPDGARLAVGHQSGTIDIWDIETEARLLTITDHDGPVRALAFDPPEGGTIWAGGESGFVRQWDASTGDELGVPKQLHDRGVRSLALSADGTYLVSAGADNAVAGWSVEDGRIGEADLRMDLGAVFAADITPDGAAIAAGGVGTVHLISVASKELVHTFGGHAGNVETVAFNGDGTLLVSADTTGLIGNLDQARLRAMTVEGHTGRVDRILFSSDRNLATSVGADGLLRQWRVSARQIDEERAFFVDPAPSDLAIGPEGIVAVTTGASGLNIFNAEGSERLSAAFASPAGPVWTVDAGPDGTLATGAVDGKLDLWSLDDGATVVARYQLGNSVVRSVDFSDDGDLGVGNDAGEVILVSDPLDSTDPTTVGIHDGGVRSVDFDGDELIAGGTDGSVRNWADGRLLGRHSDAVRSVAVHPDGGETSAAGDDGLVAIWKTSGEPDSPTATFDQHDERVWSVAYAPSGETVASGGDDQAGIILWEPSGEGTHRSLGVAGAPGRIFVIEFSPGGDLLAAGVDNTLQLWDPTTLKPIGPPLLGHTAAIRDLSFTEDGSGLVTASPDGTIRVWSVDPLAWVAQACAVADRNLAPGEWAQLRQDETYVAHCIEHPTPDLPDVREAQYGSPESLGVSRTLIAADRSIVLVLTIGVIAAGLYVLTQLRRQHRG